MSRRSPVRRPLWRLAWAALFLVGCAQARPTATPPAPAPPGARPAASAQAEPTPTEPCRPELAPLPPSGEGMWPWRDIHALDEAALRTRGLAVPLDELWSAEGGGLLSAVAGMRGCSASFVSPDGLLLTNHHCAYGALQRNATPERDIIASGYLARTREEELPGRGTRIYVFRSQEDVTERVLADMPTDLDDAGIARFLERRETALVKECERKPSTRCSISRENDGLRFALLENLELLDVRVVAAPPASLGNFGGEIDNWHWPRHTLDYALLRAYVAPDGTPADYAPENVPYRPERHLRVARELPGVGDLVMVAGKPGRTERYRLASEVGDALEWYYPLREGLFTDWIAALESVANRDEAARILTASWRKTLANALYNAKGMMVGLRRNGIVARKRDEERALSERGERGWAEAVRGLEAWLSAHRSGRERDLLLGYLDRGARMLGFARTITKWALEQEKPDAARDPGFQDRDRANLLRDLRDAQHSLHAEADQAAFRLFAGRICRLPGEERVAPFVARIGADCAQAAIARFAAELYGGTRLGDPEERTRLFGRSLAELRASDDAMIRFALALTDEREEHLARERERAGAMFRLRRPYLRALLQQRGTAYYPDANSTPRVTFGHVAGYVPRDGAYYTPYTTLDGLVAKVTGEEPFEAPEALLGAVRERDFGPWADAALGSVPLCFLSNADTTGGNSGSPALDGRGRVVGLNFDRVYENIAGDFGYTRERSRNIMVSVPAILWHLERVMGAKGLLGELLGD